MDSKFEDSNKQWAALWAAKWLILIVAFLVAGLSYAYYDRKPPVYLSSTTMLIGSSQVEEILRGDSAAAGNGHMLSNQAALLNSEEFYKSVQKRLERSHEAIAGFGVNVNPGGEADIITILVNSGSAQGSADVANAYAEEYIARREETIRSSYKTAIGATRRQADQITASDQDSVRQRAALLARVAELETLGSVADPQAQRLDVAQPATFPVSPKPKKNAIFGFVLGFLLATGCVYLRAVLDRRIRSLAELEAVFRRPVLAAIPPIRRRGRRSEAGLAPDPAMREPLRRLLTTLQLDHGLDDLGTGTRKILVTSAEKGEGKSLIVANLALVAREAGVHVAVVNADLHMSSQSQLLGVQAVPGLTDVLAGRAASSEVWQRVGSRVPQPLAVNATPLSDTRSDEGEIDVLASGTRTAGGSASLGGAVMESMLASRDGDVDYVFVDAPPPLAVSDVLPLLSSVDAIVVVSRLGHTSKASAQRLAELFERRPGAPVVGVVANGVPEEESAAFGFVSADRYSR